MGGFEKERSKKEQERKNRFSQEFCCRKKSLQAYLRLGCCCQQGSQGSRHQRILRSWRKDRQGKSFVRKEQILLQINFLIKLTRESSCSGPLLLIERSNVNIC